MMSTWNILERFVRTESPSATSAINRKAVRLLIPSLYPLPSPPLLSTFRLLTTDHFAFLTPFLLYESTLILCGPLQRCPPGVPKSDGVQID